jgi:epoxide hydrolase
MGKLTPFRIDVADEVLDDLRARLANTRWPERELVDDWSQGTPLSYVQDVCAYWADGYDWREREALLNRFDQFTTPVDGLTDPGCTSSTSARRTRTRCRC